MNRMWRVSPMAGGAAAGRRAPVVEGVRFDITTREGPARVPSGTLRSLALVGLVVLVSSGCAWIQRASIDSQGHAAVDAADAAISGTGRYVTFTSLGALYVRDLATSTTALVSPASLRDVISADGRYVAFESTASNLVPGDTNNNIDIFLRDVATGTTTRGQCGHRGRAGKPQQLRAGDLGRRSLRGLRLVRVEPRRRRHERQRRTSSSATRRPGRPLGSASVARGTQSDDLSQFAAISADGRSVAFESDASNLVTGDTNGATDVFVRDTVAGTTTRVSVGPGGARATADRPQ